MADRKKLLVNFAKKISELSYSQPKVLKRAIKNSNHSAHLQKAGRIEPPVMQTNNQINRKPESVVKNDQIENNNHSVEQPNIVFENSVLKAYIERGKHKKEKKFALHDHLFYIKVEPKKDHFPLLVNILDFLEEACNHILNQVQEFYKPEENRIAFLTLYQQPLLNGINSGAFYLHDSSTEMTNRLLGMFYQYLTSNQELKLNETFKIYLKVLSVQHAEDNKGKKKKKNYRKKHFGANNNKSTSFKYFYALNVPDGFKAHENCFKDKCLVTSIILGYLQNLYFKTARKDTRFLYAQNINSKNERKKTHAGNIIFAELVNLINQTTIEPKGPYNLEKVCEALSIFYKAQIFVFNNIHNSSKLIYTFPSNFDDSLMPIFLLQPIENSSHILFIKCISSFFRHNSRICLGCKKSFKSLNPTHLCPKKKTCFACRNFFSSANTYVHEKISSNFCDSLIANESLNKQCERCNLTLKSNNCLENHKKICFGKGYFGWKCLKCNRFFCRSRNMTSNVIKNQHQCGTKFCRNCFNYYLVREFHVCSFKKEVVSKHLPLLAFISYAMTTDKVINYLVILKESERGNFDKLVFSEFHKDTYCTKSFLVENYFNWPFLFNEFNQKSVWNHDFLAHSERLSKTEDIYLNVVQKFIKTFLTKKNWTNTTFIITDPDGTFYEQLLNELLKQGIQPKIVMNGCSIYLLTIECLNIRFLLSNMYFNGTEYDILALFDKPVEPHLFPHKFNSIENLQYKGIVPDLSYYLEFSDSLADIDRKRDVILLKKRKNMCFDLAKEVNIYCEQKVTCLAKGCIAFIQEIVNFQILLEESAPNKVQYFLHPFGAKICSISSYVFKLFKLYYINNENIFAVAKEYGSEGRKTSRGEHIFCSFMDYKFPENMFLAEFNNFSGQKYFKQAIPDLYSFVTKEAFFYNGCTFSHYHTNNCLKFPDVTDDSKTFDGRTCKEVNNIFYEKLAALKKNNSEEVKKITIIQECFFKQELKSNTELKKFFDEIYQPHCLYRLRPRVAVRGGYAEAFILKYNKHDMLDYDFYFLDINGLYTYVCSTFDFPVGAYKVILGRDLSNIVITNGLFYYNNVKMHGTLLVTVLPPKNLFIPFLLYRRSEDQLSHAILCKTCAEKKLKRPCKHPDNQRWFTSTYFVSEIEYALTLGYKVIMIHESHFYDETKPLFQDFSLKLSVLKIMHSNIFKNISSINDKERICDELNETLKLKEPFKISPQVVNPNEAKKNLMKLLANSLYGKFAQKPKNQCLIAANQAELDVLYSKHGMNIVDVNCINGDFCLVHIKQNEASLPTNRNINCYLTGQITAFARQVLDKHIRTVEKVNGQPLFCDTDSLAFVLPKNTKNPLKISDCLGDFKVVFDNVENFYALAPKTYAVVFRENNQLKTVTKIKGFNLTSSFNEGLLSTKTFEIFLDQAILLQTRKLSVPQYRKQTGTKKIMSFQFSNHLSEKRIPTPNYVTYPYGFNPN